LINQYTGASATDKFAGPIKSELLAQTKPRQRFLLLTLTLFDGPTKRVITPQGTVSVSGTAVTGSGTGWLADGVPIDARIGFGYNRS
jgi:hypothetical protein